MAEREGFEPSVELYTPHSLSRRAPSADSAISPDIWHGGGSRIRTHGPAANGTTVFKTAAFNHSAIPPNPFLGSERIGEISSPRTSVKPGFSRRDGSLLQFPILTNLGDTTGLALGIVMDSGMVGWNRSITPRSVTKELP